MLRKLKRQGQVRVEFAVILAAALVVVVIVLWVLAPAIRITIARIATAGQ